MLARFKGESIKEWAQRTRDHARAQGRQIRNSDDDELHYYENALQHLWATHRTPAWKTRFEAFRDRRTNKRTVWLRWVKEQATADDGQEWCKQLVLEAVTEKLKDMT